jgi:anti-sigma factor RsiW
MPTPSSTSSPTAAAEATPSVIPSPTPAPSPSASPTPSPTPAPTRTLRPGETPKPTPINLAPFLTAAIAIANYADDTVAVDISLLDTSTNKSQSVAANTFQPLDAVSEKVPAGDYRVSFTRPGASKPLVCQVNVKDGDQIGFGIMPAEVLVGSATAKPTKLADLVVPTSPICAK